MFGRLKLGHSECRAKQPISLAMPEVLLEIETLSKIYVKYSPNIFFASNKCFTLKIMESI